MTNGAVLDPLTESYASIYGELDKPIYPEQMKSIVNLTGMTEQDLVNKGYYQRSTNPDDGLITITQQGIDSLKTPMKNRIRFMLQDDNRFQRMVLQGINNIATDAKSQVDNYSTLEDFSDHMYNQSDRFLGNFVPEDIANGLSKRLRTALVYTDLTDEYRKHISHKFYGQYKNTLKAVESFQQGVCARLSLNVSQVFLRDV